MAPTIELMEHNQMLYDKIVEQIEKGETSIFYSEATGLGKSFIFMKLVQDYFVGKKIMYIVPKIAVWENLIHYDEFSYLDTDIEMKTFQAFNTYNSNDRLYEEYDVVFVDECHHMLSDVQGTNVAIFLEDMHNSGRYTFGFTATPYYSGVYVDEMYFDVSCYGYDVFEAIDNGLFPKVDVAVADIDFSSIPMDLCKKFSVVGTKSILEQIIDERHDVTHWLAYFGRKSDLEENEHELRLLFPEFEIVKLYQGLGNAHEIINYFESYNGKIILMSVSMLLEGMHLNNIGGVLLYRNVGARNTYFQIYGRLCKIGAKTSPLFLDVTSSILNISDDLNIFKSARFKKFVKKYSRRDIFDITSKTYRYVELSDEINPLRLKKYRDVTWTTLRSLDSSLGMSLGYTSMTMRNEGITAEEVIDRLLGEKSYDEYILSINKVFTITICGETYEYHTINELIRKIGRGSQPHTKNGFSKYIELIEWEHDKGFIIGGTYRNFDITSINTVGNAMSINPLELRSFIEEEGATVTECIDLFLDKEKWYMGIMPITWAKEVSEKSNLSVQTVKRKYKMIGNVKETIDYYLADRVYYRGVDITPRYVTAKSIALSIGTSVANVSSWLKRNNKDITGCIDYYLDKGKRVAEEDTTIDESDYNNVLGSREYTDEELKIMYTKRKEGVEWAAIVGILNSLETTVSRGIIRNVSPCITRYKRYLKEMEIDEFTHYELHKYSNEEMNVIMRMRDNGKSWKEITDVLNNLDYNRDNNIVRIVKSVSGMYARYLRMNKENKEE